MSYLDCNGVFGACDTTATAPARPPCTHANGWYIRVHFLKIFSKRIFVCTDCGASWERK